MFGVTDWTSWRTWLDRRIVVPSLASPRIMSIRSRRATGSVPVIGSSRKITFGSWTRVCAILMRWRIPFE